MTMLPKINTTVEMNVLMFPVQEIFRTVLLRHLK